MSAKQLPGDEASHGERAPEDGLSLSRDAWGQLKLMDADGQYHDHVILIPLFPITDPNRWISICAANGRELVCIGDPSRLSPASRDLLIGELSVREFMPIIQRILSVSGTAEPTEWRVETDRGATRFVLQSEEHVRRLGQDEKVSIVDANGIRYLISDVRKLDSRSRRIIEWYV
jgi:Domain of unknown function (DUF1854)